MNNKIFGLLSFSALIATSSAHALLFQTKCGIPKAQTVCQRHCCYNYYGPGAKCTEVCTKVKLAPQVVCRRTGLFDS